MHICIILTTFFIFLTDSFYSLNLQSKIKSQTLLTQNNNNRTSTSRPRTPTGYTSGSSYNENVVPYQPGIPSAFIPMSLGPPPSNNTTTRGNITPVSSRENNRTRAGYYPSGYVPEQPGIPSAFVPQPLNIARNIKNPASEAIPVNFWVNVNNTDFLLLKNRLDGYLTCNSDGSVTTNSQLLNGTGLTDELWLPEFIRYNTVALKSARGGYLYLNNSLFYCNGTVSDLNSQYKVRVGLKNDRARSVDYVSFKIDIGYLGIRDNVVMLIQQLDERSMFDPISSTRNGLSNLNSGMR